jgi:hypothetical protein
MNRKEPLGNSGFALNMLAFGLKFGQCLPGGHCERFLQSNLSNTEIAAPQEEHLRLAMTTIFLWMSELLS